MLKHNVRMHKMQAAGGPGLQASLSRPRQKNGPFLLGDPRRQNWILVQHSVAASLYESQSSFCKVDSAWRWMFAQHCFTVDFRFYSQDSVRTTWPHLRVRKNTDVALIESA